MQIIISHVILRTTQFQGSMHFSKSMLYAKSNKSSQILHNTPFASINECLVS